MLNKQLLNFAALCLKLTTQCVTEEQTADHILATCFFNISYYKRDTSLAALDDDTRDWLHKNNTQHLIN